MSLNREDLALYQYAKITFIHPVMNAQWHGVFGLPFFDTPCTVYIVKLKSKSAFTTDKYTSSNDFFRTFRRFKFRFADLKKRFVEIQKHYNDDEKITNIICEKKERSLKYVFP